MRAWSGGLKRGKPRNILPNLPGPRTLLPRRMRGARGIFSVLSLATVVHETIELVEIQVICGAKPEAPPVSAAHSDHAVLPPTLGAALRPIKPTVERENAPLP